MEAGITETFGSELGQYFDFEGSFGRISSGRKADGCQRSVYLTDIKEEFCAEGLPGSVIIKELSTAQAENYRKLSNIWNPYLEMVYGVLEKDGYYISINEFVEAPKCLDCEMRSINLEEYVCRFGCLEEREALILLWQLCEGIKTLRKIGLNHGDISPRNIMMADSHEWDTLYLPYAVPGLKFSAKLIDFDISKETKGSNHTVTTILGTKLFAAPEILDYRYPSDRVDIYSLGCILHYMLAGKSPKESQGNLGKRLITTGVYAIIERCTSGYTDRYQNVAALQKDILRQLRTPLRQVFVAFSYIPGFRSGKPWKIAIALVVYACIFMLGFLLFLLDKELMLVFLRMVTAFFLELILVFDVFHLGNLSKTYMRYRDRFPALKYIVKFLAGFAALMILVRCV